MDRCQQNGDLTNRNLDIDLKSNKENNEKKSLMKIYFQKKKSFHAIPLEKTQFTCFRSIWQLASSIVKFVSLTFSLEPGSENWPNDGD